MKPTGVPAAYAALPPHKACELLLACGEHSGGVHQGVCLSVDQVGVLLIIVVQRSGSPHLVCVWGLNEGGTTYASSLTTGAVRNVATPRPSGVSGQLLIYL